MCGKLRMAKKAGFHNFVPKGYCHASVSPLRPDRGVPADSLYLGLAIKFLENSPLDDGPPASENWLRITGRT